jgi:hypothetical protein
LPARLSRLALAILDKVGRHPLVQIFGTDLDTEAIETARIGQYFGDPSFRVWAALEWLTTNLRRRYRLQVRLKGNERDLALEENVGLVLFTSNREILINVAKHAQTDFASVSLHHSNDLLEVNIRDIGKGFDLKNQSRQRPESTFRLVQRQRTHSVYRGLF